ncbi:MAG: hypothetical protein R2796_02230 [Chitinophagaceae bacterium]|nr:hypothetical protein [Chitinophagaceae bacterium]
MVQQNRLGHALLFLGKEGNGSLLLALAFAQYLVCEKNGLTPAATDNSPSLFGAADTANATPQPAKDSCGVCPSCIKAGQLIHPDIHFSYPTVVTKQMKKPIATEFIKEWRSFITQNPYGNLFDWISIIKENENSQGNITAEECNDIIRKLSLKSFESPYKILMLWMPEYLGKSGNKLLKLIEEPPPDTLIILVAENEDRILPTILSRCQLIKIPILKPAEIEKALTEREQANPATAAQVAAIAEGNYREAVSFLQHAGDNWEEILRNWLNAILKTGPVAQTHWVTDISHLGRENQKQFLHYFIHLLDVALQLRVGDAARLSSHFSATEIDFAARLNKMTGIEQQEAMIHEADRASYYIERNANSKLLFHALTIKLFHIIRDKVVFLD